MYSVVIWAPKKSLRKKYLCISYPGHQKFQWNMPYTKIIKYAAYKRKFFRYVSPLSDKNLFGGELPSNYHAYHTISLL